jgi:hypothetical protein
MVNDSTFAHLKQGGEVPFVKQYVLLTRYPIGGCHKSAADSDVFWQEPSQDTTEKCFMCTADLPGMANEVIQRPELRV